MTCFVSNIRRLSTTSRYLVSSTWVNKQRQVWSADKVVRSIFDDVEIPDVTLVEHIWNCMERWPQKTAIVCGVTGKGYKYEEIYNLSNTFAVNLRRKFGIVDEDRVAVMLPNIPQFPIVFFGILSGGGIPTTINPIYTAYEVQKQVLLSEPKVAIVTPANVNVMKEALTLSQRDIPIIVVRSFGEDLDPETVSFDELIEDVHVDKTILKDVKRKSRDVCVLPYSSGTTGLPKGVELTNKNLVANVVQQNIDELRYHRPTTETHQDSILATLPFFHSYGLSVVMLHKLCTGVRLVTLPKFEPKLYRDTLIKYKINVAYAAPPTILFLATHPEVRKEHLENMNTIISGGAPLPEADIINFLDKAQHVTFCQGYGLTETSPLATLLPPGSKAYTTVGFPIPNIEMKILDSENRPLGPNEVGELLIKGPNVMKGYRGNEKATKDTFTEDNYLKTGDMATIDEEGKVKILDRLKELIKVKGFQVPPAELESVLKDHNGVLDAAVVGVNDPIAGEKPKAFVVLKEGHKLDEKELIQFVDQRVAPYKRIKSIQFLDDIPKNASGKILRRVLKETYCK